MTPKAYATGSVYLKELSYKYQVSIRLISLITRNENWKHI